MANAPHVPVHLGAMSSTVQWQLEHWCGGEREGLAEGDVLVTNHPRAGGSHLPDIRGDPCVSQWVCFWSRVRPSRGRRIREPPPPQSMQRTESNPRKYISIKLKNN